MKSSGTTGLFMRVGSLSAMMLLCACGRAPEADAVEQAKPALPPAIIPPAEVADPAEPPSYEVGIATAAADRNRAKQKCAEKSERLRAICEAEADAAFTSAQSGLEDLRGNQP
jgi:hypothetical protein